MYYQESEKFISENFYSDSFDSKSKLNVISLIEETLINNNKKKDPDYYNHRPGVVHASSIYKCMRGIIHEMLGAQKDKEIETRKLGIFQAGNLFEEYVINALGDKVVERQREYTYKYKSIILVGRSDCIINDDGVMRIGECKSVNSESFWMREREGTLVAWHNQVQLQIYMWLERELFGNNYDAELIYISKDDCTVIHSALKYNPEIIEKVVKPALDIINEGYVSKNPLAAPLPAPIIFSDAKNMYQKNWLANYCDYHNQCDPGWFTRATMEVTKRNLELKSAKFPHTTKKEKPNIQIL